MTPTDLIQSFGIVANLLTATVAAVVAFRIYRNQQQDSTRAFCFELQRQFDSPEMLKCRYSAWKVLQGGTLNNVTTTDQLLQHPDYTVEVSTVLHFFETLDRFADQRLINVQLAGKMFKRSYMLWYDLLIKRIEHSQNPNNRVWMASIKGLSARFA